MFSVSDYVRQRLRCPICASRIVIDEECRCTNERCSTRFPIVDGVPVLINEKTSVFRHADFAEKRKTFFDPNARPGIKERLARLLYENTSDVKGAPALATFARLVNASSATPRVLVIGAGMDSEALAALRSTGRIELVATDVSLSENVSIICDAHDLPFDDDTFDGVMARAVLEHVLDPYRCVDEMHRVLCRDGVVFSETPFIQQVHGGRYDFTRFTHLGHRRLFRRYEEIESGASAGPGLALSWSYQYFLLSFAQSKMLTRIMRVFGKLTSFWWKYFDPYLIDRPGALDAASALYFLGRKSDTVFSDRQLVDSYRGANHR
jgi:SAM-dependent methyltransferase